MGWDFKELLPEVNCDDFCRPQYTNMVEWWNVDRHTAVGMQSQCIYGITERAIAMTNHFSSCILAVVSIILVCYVVVKCCSVFLWNELLSCYCRCRSCCLYFFYYFLIVTLKQVVVLGRQHNVMLMLFVKCAKQAGYYSMHGARHICAEGNACC